LEEHFGAKLALILKVLSGNFAVATCPKQGPPICGCDNRTYPNDCERRVAGVSLQSEGECPAPAAGKG